MAITLRAVPLQCFERNCIQISPRLGFAKLDWFRARYPAISRRFREFGNRTLGKAVHRPWPNC